MTADRPDFRRADDPFGIDDVMNLARGPVLACEGASCSVCDFMLRDEPREGLLWTRGCAHAHHNLCAAEVLQGQRSDPLRRRATGRRPTHTGNCPLRRTLWAAFPLEDLDDPDMVGPYPDDPYRRTQPNLGDPADDEQVRRDYAELMARLRRAEVEDRERRLHKETRTPIVVGDDDDEAVVSDESDLDGAGGPGGHDTDHEGATEVTTHMN